MIDIQPEDKKFYKVNPDPGFNPNRNQAIVDRTIEKYEKKRKEQMKKFKQRLGERTSAVADFLTSNKGIGSRGPIKGRLERYFGRRYLAKLRGETIVDKLRQRLNIGPNNRPFNIVGPNGKLLGKQVSDVRKKKE